eukprot:g17165.t1
MTYRWTRSALVGASLLGGAHAAVTVSMPSKGLPVLAGSMFTVEWAGTTDESRVEIDLYHCGEDCSNPDSCGDWVAALCTCGANGDAGCSQDPDAPGEYDVKIPEPHDPDIDVEDSQYKVRVRTGMSAGCSAAFPLVPSEKAPQPGDVDGPFLQVISPMEDDGALAGEDYTVEFAYDNGLGSSVDRFKIDLYYADIEGGDCGKWLTSICDKPDIGCKDSTGDYDVTIPAGTAPGQYRIRVGRFADDSLYGCSGTFHVTRNEDNLSGYGGGRTPVAGNEPHDLDDWAFSMSMGFSYTFHDHNDPHYPGGGGGGDGGMDDDDWWIAMDDEDDKSDQGPGSGRGGGGLWGDDDDEQEEGAEERPKKELDTDDFSFSFELVWTAEAG